MSLYGGMSSHAHASPVASRSPLPSDVPPAAEKAWNAYFRRHPVVARLDHAAWGAAEIVGPLFWAALIVLYLWAAATPTG